MKSTQNSREKAIPNNTIVNRHSWKKIGDLTTKSEEIVSNPNSACEDNDYKKK